MKSVREPENQQITISNELVEQLSSPFGKFISAAKRDAIQHLPRYSGELPVVGEKDATKQFRMIKKGVSFGSDFIYWWVYMFRCNKLAGIFTHIFNTSISQHHVPCPLEKCFNKPNT